MVARYVEHTLYADGVPFMTVERLCTDSYSYLDFARETAKQQLAIDRAVAQQKLDMNICKATGCNPLDTSICQDAQYMPKTEPEPFPEPESVYKEKINVKWYELLILAALAWAPFMLGLLLKLLNS